MTKSHDAIGIGQLVPTLLQSYDGPRASYRKVLEAVQKGVIPATFTDGRWRVAPGDLPNAARVLGMTPKSEWSDRAPAR